MKRFARLARLNMMTPSSLLRITVILLGISAVIVLGGCRKPSTSFFQESSQPRHQTTQQGQTAQPQSTSTTESDNGEKHAVTAVTTYLKALTDSDFKTAYELLSRDSKDMHSISEFEQLGKQGMPSFDLKSATATVTGEKAVVTVQQDDDPATHDFNLVTEDGEWKIVYRGGVPGMPYAE